MRLSIPQETIGAMNSRKQSGAALVVALILLVALTLLALSSMNTASLDLIMAGNESFRTRAFNAAESGIESAFLNDDLFDSSTDTAVAATGTGIGNDAYSIAVGRPNDGNIDPAPAGFGSGYGAIHFRIIATGTSERSTTATHTQEVFEVLQSAPENNPLDECANTNLDETTSSC